MALRHVSRAQITLAALSLLGLTWLALMALRSHPGGRSAVLAQIEKPASAPTATVGPGPVATSLEVAGYTAAVRIPVNRASDPQVVSVSLTGPSGRVEGARVTLSYSMPSMNMPSVLTTSLASRGGGVYSARAAALEMPGDWLLSFRITPAHGRALLVALADRMRR